MGYIGFEIVKLYIRYIFTKYSIKCDGNKYDSEVLGHV